MDPGSRAFAGTPPPRPGHGKDRGPGPRILRHGFDQRRVPEISGREDPIRDRLQRVGGALMSAAGSSPSTDELVTLGAPVTLRDGSRVRIRQGQRSDRELLLRGFERLSPESRYRRFLVPVAELSDEMVRYLTEIDHHDHEAMIAIDEQTGEGIGVARYVRNQDRPEVAELAVTVIDDWQAKGLGTLLVEVLSGRAREEGITAFSALMLARNQEMIDLLKRLDHVRIVDQEVGTVEIEMPIPAIGLAPALKRLLQIAGRHDLVVPLAGRDARSRLAAYSGG